MRVRVVLYLIGSVLLYLAFAMLAPLLWAMWEHGPDRIAFSIAIVTTLVSGWLLIGTGETTSDISLRESMAFVTLAWLTAACFSAIPFYASGVCPKFLDAFFEAMSGLTTTGATIFSDIESLPRGLLFWRSMTHWLGGMGIIVLFVAVFPRLGVSASYMMQAESPGPITQRIVPRITQTAKILWVIYIVVSVAQTTALLLLDFSLFDALTHTFGTVATGGFSTKNASIATFGNAAVEWVIILFMMVAGFNFALYYQMFFGKISAVLKDGEARFYLMVVSLVSVLVFMNIRGLYESSTDGLRAAVFQVTSMLTTTGFTTTDYDAWPVFSRTFLLILMFLGGCGGSTAGAIKQIRILVAIKFLVREMKKTVSPHMVQPIRVGSHVLHQETVNSIVAFVGLYFIIFIFSSLYLTYLGYDLTTAISAVAATQGNVGPGLGAVGPTNTYATLHSNAKMLLSLLMLVGRLEIYTVFAFMLPDFGLRIKYPVRKMYI